MCVVTLHSKPVDPTRVSGHYYAVAYCDEHGIEIKTLNGVCPIGKLEAMISLLEDRIQELEERL